MRTAGGPHGPGLRGRTQTARTQGRAASLIQEETRPGRIGHPVVPAIVAAIAPLRDRHDILGIGQRVAGARAGAGVPEPAGGKPRQTSRAVPGTTGVRAPQSARDASSARNSGMPRPVSALVTMTSGWPAV